MLSTYVVLEAEQNRGAKLKLLNSRKFPGLVSALGQYQDISSATAYNLTIPLPFELFLISSHCPPPTRAESLRRRHFERPHIPGAEDSMALQAAVRAIVLEGINQDC